MNIVELKTYALQSTVREAFNSYLATQTFEEDGTFIETDRDSIVDITQVIKEQLYDILLQIHGPDHSAVTSSDTPIDDYMSHFFDSNFTAYPHRGAGFNSIVEKYLGYNQSLVYDQVNGNDRNVNNVRTGMEQMKNSAIREVREFVQEHVRLQEYYDNQPQNT